MKWREKGTLPVGVEVEGVVHRDFVLRDTTVKDLIEVDHIASGQGRQVALMARCLIKLGGLEPKDITPNLLHTMTYVDLQALQAADGRLMKRQLTFRVAKAKPEEGDPLPGHEDGVE